MSIGNNVECKNADMDRTSINKKNIDSKISLKEKTSKRAQKAEEKKRRVYLLENWNMYTFF